MNQVIPSMVMGFREGLEAFLLIAIILKYIKEIDQTNLKNKVWQGVVTGIVISLVLGVLLNYLSIYLGGVDSLTKVWESLASLFALLLVTTFIFWMIRHGHNIVGEVRGQVKNNLSELGLFLISLVIVAREGTEIAVFSFAGKYPYAYVSLGVLASLVLTILIFYSLVRINIGLLFKITLAYLILQAGFLLGYTIHEGLSAMKSYGVISTENAIYQQAFDLSKTILSHKEGAIGIAFHVLFGWYSKPEWIQFIIQYTYTFAMFGFWWQDTKNRNKREIKK